MNEERAVASIAQLEHLLELRAVGQLPERGERLTKYFPSGARAG